MASGRVRRGGCAAWLLIATAALGGCAGASYEHRQRSNEAMSAGTIRFKPAPGYERGPSLLAGPAPVYPIEAALNGDEGLATITFVIGRDGAVHDLKLLSASGKYFGDHLLLAAAQWTFEPALRDGVAADYPVSHFTYRYCHPAPGVDSICDH